MLELSKIEAYRASLHLAACDLHQLVANVCSMFSARVMAKRLSLTAEVASDLPTAVLADEGKIRQILVNLVGNAVKFTEAGGITLRLSAWTQDRLRWLVQIDIEDTGSGIAAAELGGLFRQFEQAAAGRKIGAGTGLGLVISREFARIMGGDITVRSVEGRGSVFTVTLRLDAVAAEPTPPRRSSRPRLRRLSAGQLPCKVLVVDDQEDSSRMLSELLGSVGFEIETAANGVEAIAQFQRHRPRAILMDLRMPLMDGAEATRQIRTMAGGQEVRILGLSASVITDLRTPMEGVDDFLGKPFQSDELLDRLRGMLNLRFETDLPAPPAAPRSLTEIPPHLVEPLRRAVVSADLDAALALLDELSAEAPGMAAELRALLDNFEWDRIAGLLPPPS